MLSGVASLGLALGDKHVVLLNLGFLDFGLSAGKRTEVTAALETLRGDESLDLGAVGASKEKMHIMTDEEIEVSQRQTFQTEPLTHALV